MKKIISLLVIVTSLTLVSCSKEKNDDSIDAIAGTWKLVYVTGSITGVSHHFEPGVVSWTINPTTHVVTVVNNNTNDNMIDIAETGNYNYQVSTDPNPSGCGETFIFDEIMDLGCVSIENGHLIMNQNYADGMRVEFER
jgi:hypothetical protein